MATKRKKLTKTQEAAIDAEREARMQAWEAWRDRAHGKTFQAKVTAWDRLRGEGLVYVPEFNATFEIFACNVAGKKTWYPETASVFYEKGQTVDVRFDVQYTKTFVIGLTPGTPDTERWEQIKDTGLAFRCNEAGEAVNGLFG